MEEDNMALIVDSKDDYLEDDSVFYIHPERLSLVSCLENNQFSKCIIKNSPAEFLSSLNLNHVLKKLKIDAPLEIEISQKISVLRPEDAKQVEAMASLAGFKNTKIIQDKKTHAYKVTCIRSQKESKLIEVEVVKQDPKKNANSNANANANANSQNSNKNNNSNKTKTK
jgi:hypothetical protein